VLTASGALPSARTTSSSGIFCTGEKKCIPTTRSGRATPSAAQEAASARLARVISAVRRTGVDPDHRTVPELRTAVHEAALELLGIRAGEPRLPYVPLDDEERAQLRTALERHGLLEPART